MHGTGMFFSCIYAMVFRTPMGGSDFSGFNGSLPQSVRDLHGRKLSINRYLLYCAHCHIIASSGTLGSRECFFNSSTTRSPN